ncbi:1-phosphatidylinositol 4-kinase STT4 [Rhodotorula paludigena]|uniref:1-phosphatidylinositol 4-kinase STT4 n=1 Tax=Rhodotorula paludigena TaxID=86838 RepID=UPI0031706F45
MDALDGSLHAQLLGALAANLASTSHHDDLALLTTAFDAHAPATTRQVNGVLARVNGEHPAASDDEAALSPDQVDSIVAFAEYTTLAPDPDTAPHADRILALVRSLPHTSLEPALGLHGAQDCAPADRLAYALTTAALHLAVTAPSSRNEALEALEDVQQALEQQTRQASPHRVIGYVLPALNGLQRAFVSPTPFTFTISDTPPRADSLSNPALAELRGVFASALSSEQQSQDEQDLQNQVVATLELYEASAQGSLAPTTPLVAAMAVQQSYWTSLLLDLETSSTSTSSAEEQWRALLATRSKGKGKALDPAPLPIASQIAAEGVAARALEAWHAVLAAVESEAAATEEDDAPPVDLGAPAALVAALRLASVASLAAAKLDPALFAVVEGLLHPDAGGIDEGLQVAAAEAVQLLASGFPSQHPAALELVRAFLLSPALRPSDDPSSHSRALVACTSAYSALLSHTPSARASAVQTLLNHLAAIERQGHVAAPQPPSQLPGGRSASVSLANGHGHAEGDTAAGESFGASAASEDVASNVVHVVALLARQIGEVRLVRLVLATLQHHAATSSPSVVCAALYELGELAAGADAEAFVEVLRCVSGVARRARSSEEAVYQATIAAYSRLAETAANKHEVLGETFLTELLTLFAHKSGAITNASDRSTAEERTSTLLALVTVLEGYLSRVAFDPLVKVVSSSLGALFRSFWYSCLLAGFLSPRARLSDWQRSSLQSVAKRSPPLVVGHSADLVELEAQLETILKSGADKHVLSVEAVRGELAAAVPSQASHARSVPAPVAVFLATTLRLEALRADAGAFAPFFLYLSVPALSGAGPAAEALRSIGDAVLSAYIARLSTQVPQHAMDSSAYAQVRAVLLHAADCDPQVRETALKYLDNLLTSFPSLVCNLGVVTVMLELLTVLRRSCLDEFTDEYTPSFSFHSTRGDFTLSLLDDYPLRNRILRDLHTHVRTWLRSGLTRSPLDMQGLLQEYIDVAGDGYRMGMLSDDEMGKSVAVDLVKLPPANGPYAALPAWGNWKADAATAFARTFAAKSFFGGEAQRGSSDSRDVLDKLEDLEDKLEQHTLPLKLSELRDLFYRGAAQVVKTREPDFDILHHVVALPVRLFTEASLAVGQEIWTWIADARPELEPRVVADMLEAWAGTIEKQQGLFSRSLDVETPLNQETQYTPTDKDELTRTYLLANRLFVPMISLLDFLSSRFQAFRYRSADLVHATFRFLVRVFESTAGFSRHPLSRELRFRLISFGFCILHSSRLESTAEYNLRTKLYDAALDWFAARPTWSFGSSRIQLKADLQAIDELARFVAADTPSFGSIASSFEARGLAALPNRISVSSARSHHSQRKQLLGILLKDEADRLRLWLNPLGDSSRGATATGEAPNVEELRKLARSAWPHWPEVVVYLTDRFKLPPLADEVAKLVRSDPVAVQDCADALSHFVGESLSQETRSKIRHLLYWKPVPVPEALRFLFPKFGGDPVLLQYALRVLEHHPVEVTFFYVPQVVQALRSDELGYAERFIFETSKISQLFCHQIIWNMKANAYRGDDAEEPDPMKPKLDRLVDMIFESLSGDAQDFYNREFSFFDEVTSISGKLKPFIKASKPEKKAKIDEEMAKIKVEAGVYLPSNPDGIVVDINRKSGRPLQSHAKAPFMATFKVRRQRSKLQTNDLEAQDQLISVEGAAHTSDTDEYDTWQSAIFKVGDDCRQDVLALQIIAMHKNIFNSLGLDLLVTPYRVTATAPGCGVVDVIPNSTSRDEMGRAKINDLQSFFVMKFGPLGSPEFQHARNQFVQSMAAYSLLCYIVQIKDRHNGNIMIDARGRIAHIDFGFLFDIGPGGVKFEPNSFKLSHEMVVLMGGRDSVGFRNFRELTVKAFLAARPFAQSIVDTVGLMLAAEFPSFKGEPTLERLMARFRPELSEKDAAAYMSGVIDNAYENKRSIVYDEFQRRTNGIPYVR